VLARPVWDAADPIRTFTFTGISVMVFVRGLKGGGGGVCFWAGVLMAVVIGMAWIGWDGEGPERTERGDPAGPGCQRRRTSG
jgi:hypothetical protein